MSDTEVQQLIIYVGTQAKIDEARQAGTIGPDDFAVVTDAPEFQTKLTSANAGTGISITEVGGVLKISNTQTSAEWGNILGNLPDQADLWAYLSDILGYIDDIKDLIPAQASSSNQLADKDFVNSSISTNTSNFIGTFESVSALKSYSGDVTNNDYSFVINHVVTNGGNDWATFNELNVYDKTLLTNFDYAWVINGSNFDLYRFDIVNQVWELRAEDIEKDSVSLNTAYNRYKATVSGSTVNWEYEFTLNNSSFTASQWEAINSGATEAKINQITTNQNAIGTLSNLTTTEKTNLVGAINELDSSKQDNISDLQQIREGAAAGASSIQGVQVNGADLNPDANKKVNVQVPTNTNQLTNGAGYITLSALNGYATQTWVGQQGYLTSTALNGYATEEWVGQQGYITSSALSGYQTTSNLVTSVSSSSTDSQYPSAKLFYDTCGDIESIINAIRGV